MTLTYVVSGFAVSTLIGLTRNAGGSRMARSVPETFLRGLLVTTLTGVAAKLVF